LIDENRILRDIAESDRENLAWPHSVEDGHPEDQAFAGVKHSQSLADLFRGHHPSIRIRLAWRREQCCRRVRFDQPVAQSSLRRLPEMTP
jgi:hypothetical protein